MRHSVERIWLLSVLLIMSLAMVSVIGCGGGGCVSKGCVTGWVYASLDGQDVIISGSDTPPEGYEPVERATVYIQGGPDRRVRTDANGYYYIQGVTLGTRTVVVEVVGREYRFSVPVRSGHCTVGGGHSEGGGGS